MSRLLIIWTRDSRFVRKNSLVEKLLVTRDKGATKRQTSSIGKQNFAGFRAVSGNGFLRKMKTEEEEGEDRG